MRNFFVTTLSLGFLLTGIIFVSPKLSQEKKETKLFPPPIGTLVVGNGDESEEHKKFLAWYENMHRCAPGTNWREMDAHTRYEKYLTKKNKPFYRVASQETLANGNLIGEWREKGSVNQAGRIHVATKDTTTGKIYCGSSGGNMWRGNANGTGWTVLNDQMRFNNIMNIYLMPTQTGTRIVVPVGGANVFYSDDDGASWTPTTGLANIQSWGWFVRSTIADDSRNTIYLLGTQWDYVNWYAETVVYRSTDAGTSFSEVISWDEPAEGTSDRFDIYSAIKGDSSTFLIHDGEISTMNYTTGLPDSLSSFTLNNNGFTMLTGADISGTHSLYAFVDQDIYKSSNAGMTWNFVADIGMSPFFRTSFSASLTQPDYLFFGNVECHKSTDAGASWNIVNSWVDYYGNPATKLHADVPSIIPFYDNGMVEKEFIGTDGGLFLTDNLGATVTNLSLFGLNVSQYYTSYTNRNDPNFIYVGTQDQGYQRCQQDSGTVLGFTQVISGDYAHMVSANGGTTLWMTYPGTLDYISYAPFGGVTATWNYSSYGFPLWLPPLMVDPTNETKLLIAGGNLSTSGSKLIECTVSGTNINAVEQPYDFDAASSGGHITALEFSPMNNIHRYVATDNGAFFHSTNSGTNWTMTAGFTGPGSHYFYGNDIIASKVNLGTVYIGGAGYSDPGFYRSTNHGQTFTPANNGLPNTLIFDLEANYDESLIFAATEVGPYVYVVSEDQWYDMAGVSAPDQTYWEVDYIPSTNTARFVTYGRGIWDFAITYPIFTSIHSPANENQWTLFPNPVKDHFSLRRDQPLDFNSTLEIFDMSGRKVLEKNILVGEKEVVVTLPNFVSGMYLCEVRTRDKKWTTKFVVE